MRNFAMGAIYAKPSGANPTPVPFAILKDAKIGYKQAKKPIRGNQKAPLDVADGALDISVSAKNADFRAQSLALLSAGATTAIGSKLLANGESWTVPTTPFQVTVSNSATMSEDGGVYDATAGKWMTRGATATGTGVYAVNEVTGVYTFNTADAGHFVLITYLYTSASIGTTTTFNNQMQGASTGYLVRVFNMYSIAGVSKPLGFEFPSVHFAGIDVSLKVEDWSEQGIEGIAAQDPASTLVYKAYTGD